MASPKIGIFQEGSHRIVDIPRCGVHHPRINEVASVVRASMQRTGTPPYADGPHRGLVRYLQLTVDPASQRVQLVVVTNSETSQPAAALLDDLTNTLGDRLHSLIWNGQPRRENAILGDRFEHIHGPSVLELSIGGAQVFYPPAAFIQNNLPMYARVVEQVHAWVPDGAHVAEYYAGVGAIGLGLASRCARVAFNELTDTSLEGLKLGIDALDTERRERTSVHAGGAATCLDALQGATTVIVDPPRRGLDAALVRELIDRPVDNLIYISCGLTSFQTDAAALLDDGPYRLEALVAADLFPFTGHIESLARFAVR